MPLRRQSPSLRRHPLLYLAVLTFTVSTLYAQTSTTLYTFTGTDGGNPKSTLVLDAAGNLFGATTGAGSYGSGTVFKIDTSNNCPWCTASPGRGQSRLWFGD